MVMYFNDGIVFLSYAISFLGAYITISLCEQLRLFHLYNKDGWKTNFVDRYKWFLLMGISLGGVGIWCMHFIGMSAMRLKYQDHLSGEWIGVPLYYNIWITVLSLLIAIITTGIGMYVLSYDPLFAKSKSEILEMFVNDLQNLTISDLKKKRNLTIIKLIVTKQLGSLILGGAITGTGVVLMHYIGMAAVNFEGKINWNWGIVAASIFIAIIVATAAYWILFRLLSIFPNKEFLRIVSSMVMAIAVCGMHYTAMCAAEMEVELNNSKRHDLSTNSGYVANSNVEITVLLCAMFTLWTFVMIIFADIRTNTAKFLFFMKKNHLNFSFTSVGTVSTTSGRTIRSPETSISLRNKVKEYNSISRNSGGHYVGKIFPEGGGCPYTRISNATGASHHFPSNDTHSTNLYTIPHDPVSEKSEADVV
jgi:NO-binding membrane sensor protein with MHYT domain